MQIGAAYIRVSTEDQVEFSPDSQLKKIKEYAQHNRIHLPEEFIFVDEGISGRSASKRPAFMQMIGMAKKKPKPFDVIMVWKFSRFARNRQDSIFYKSMLRKDCGIDVISISEQLTDDPTSILIEALLEAMDEYYSINLAEEVKRGMTEKFSRGGVVSQPPFGYIMGEDRFEIDQEKAAYVRMVYDDYLNGAGYRQIAQKLNQIGVRTTRGNLWENRTVEYLLTNPVYIGKLRRNPNGKDAKDRYHLSEEVDIVDGHHEPIIKEEIWKQCQDLIAKNKAIQPKYTRTVPAAYMLQGLVRCSCCGGTLTQTVKGVGMQCHKYAHGQCQESHYISMPLLIDAILDTVESDLQDAALNITVKQTESEDTYHILRTQLSAEQRKLQRVKEAYEAGIDTLEEYRQNKEKILLRIDELEAGLLPSATSQEETAKVFRGRVREALPKLRSEEVSEEEKNVLLKSFISHIVFNRKESTIRIYYYV